MDLGLDLPRGSLQDRFVVPPFSVLDTRQGYWQQRRREWLALGIRGELGRGAQKTANDFSPQSAAYSGGWDNHPGAVRPVGLLSHATERKGFGADYNTSKGENAWGGSGTSIFDPVLCELAYRWFAPAGGLVLDPFAGGSVRGIVASHLGHSYIGIDLSGDQLAANRLQAEEICEGTEQPVPEWINGDSRQVLASGLPGLRADLVFSCPPYHDLEVYGDDPRDLSVMSWHEFLEAYEAIIELACERLLPGRFAAFVVSEIRGPDGAYRGLVPRTIHAFERVGMRFYNDAILVNTAGSLPIRATRYFEASRKLGRTHQNLLVFVKGSPERGWSYEREAPPDPQMSWLEVIE